MQIERIELGCPGHHVASADCLFRRHTRIDRDGIPLYAVSTVGNYIIRGEGKVPVGSGRLFETMVFALTDKPADRSDGCGCHEVLSWENIDFQGYQTAGEAQQGHEIIVASWMTTAFYEEDQVTPDRPLRVHR